MQHQYTTETIQAAIDAALDENEDLPSRLETEASSLYWQREAPARLTLARELLERLPEPTCDVVDGKTPGQVAFECYNGPLPWSECLTKHKWERVASAALAAFGSNLEAAIARMEAVTVEALVQVFWKNGIAVAPQDGCNAVRARLIAAARDGQGEVVDWKAKYEEMRDQSSEHLSWSSEWQSRCAKEQDRAEKAEVELAEIKDYLWPDQTGLPNKHRNALIAIKRREELLGKLPQLRPLSEAGTVPEGCVRVTGFMNDRWIIGLEACPEDTHFADILFPASQAPAAEAAKKEMPCGFNSALDVMPDEPETFTAHGKTWTRHTPGDPMPCDGNALVHTLMLRELSGLENDTPSIAARWCWDASLQSSNIIGWRYADESTPADTLSATSWQPAVGDTVRLKSGGPVMTIARPAVGFDGELIEEEWKCVWVTNGGEAYNLNIHPACLEPATKEEQP